MSLNCTLDSGFVLSCNTIGGIQKVWLGTWSADATYAYDANNVVTGVTSATTVYAIEQDLEFAGLTQTGNFSRENGTVFYQSDLALKFVHLDADLRNLINALGRAPLYAVVQSNSGEYFILGVESSGRATAGDSSLGTLLGDLNGSTLTLTWKSANGAFLINGSLVGTSITIG